MHAYVHTYILDRQIEWFGPAAEAQGALDWTTREQCIRSRSMCFMDVDVLAVYFSRVAPSAALASAGAEPKTKNYFCLQWCMEGS